MPRVLLESSIGAAPTCSQHSEISQPTLFHLPFFFHWLLRHQSPRKGPQQGRLRDEAFGDVQKRIWRCAHAAKLGILESIRPRTAILIALSPSNSMEEFRFSRSVRLSPCRSRADVSKACPASPNPRVRQCSYGNPPAGSGSSGTKFGNASIFWPCSPKPCCRPARMGP